MASHLSHLLGKGTHIARNGRILQVAQDVVTVSDRLHISQRRVKVRLQVIFVSIGSDRINDLVKVQIGKYFGTSLVIDSDAPLGPIEKDAVKGQRLGALRC